MRTKYTDLPEPTPTPCPVRPDAVDKIRTGRLIAEALWKTGEEYHAGAINYAEFGARTRASWDEAAREGVVAEVRRELRRASR